MKPILTGDQDKDMEKAREMAREFAEYMNDFYRRHNKDIAILHWDHFGREIRSLLKIEINTPEIVDKLETINFAYLLGLLRLHEAETPARDLAVLFADIESLMRAK